LNRSLDFELASDQRVDATVLSHAVEVARIFLERAAALGIPLGVRLRIFLVGGLLFGNLRKAVRDVVDDVQPRYVLAIEEEHSVTLLLAEDGHQHIGDADFLFSARLHMKHGALQYTLKA